MSFLRFGHVYFLLLLLSALSAFVLPTRFTQKAHPELQALFAPASWPVRAVASRVSRRLNPPGQSDPRTKEALLDENQELRQTNAQLWKEVDQLREIARQLPELGTLQERCTTYAVTGGDPGTRDSLLLRGSTFENVLPGKFVLYPGGVVGQIARAGAGGAQVRLVTDQSFVVRGYFTSNQRDANGLQKPTPLAMDPVLVKGIGNGEMLAQRVVREAAEKASLGFGISVLVNDPDWPRELQNRQLGTVVEVLPRRDSPLHVDVRIRPPSDLRQLRWVMVMNK